MCTNALGIKRLGDLPNIQTPIVGGVHELVRLSLSFMNRVQAEEERVLGGPGAGAAAGGQAADPHLREREETPPAH